MVGFGLENGMVDDEGQADRDESNHLDADRVCVPDSSQRVFPTGILRAEICSVSDRKNRLAQEYAGGIVPIVLRKVQRYGFAVVIQ